MNVAPRAIMSRMVSIANPLSETDCQDFPNVSDWLDTLQEQYGSEERAALQRACDWAGARLGDQRLPCGMPVLRHAIGTADVLSGMRMDVQSLCAAILHFVTERQEADQEEFDAAFGRPIRVLAEGVARMGQIQGFGIQSLHEHSSRDDQAQVETLRKMLLAMVEDIRVVVIKLAERTHLLRCLGNAEEEYRQGIAREVQGIFAPLANRLGMWQLKWELEDLSMRFLEPSLYKKIALMLDEKRIDRERYIQDVVHALRAELQKLGIEAEVRGRPKHITSIINKMRRKNLGFEQLYDVRAVRVLVPDVKDCYTVLGIVHHIWQPIPGEFDDYISHPKSNDYRSLHTAVIGPEGKALEVQVRTFEMHQHAELGVAAHWRYKEGGKGDVQYDEKIAWLRQILEWKDDLADSGDMLEHFKNELFQERVYVLTPQGRVIDLPAGATPIDFAYHVHTDLGDRCRGARVDGNIVPLNYVLQNGQRVEVLTSKQGGPSRDWLNPALGYLKSSRARAKVRHWFKYQHFDENLAQGRAQFDREIHRLGITSVNHEKVAQRLGFNKVDDFLAALGRGDVQGRSLTQALHAEAGLRPVPSLQQPTRGRPSASPEAGGILVGGVGNVLTTLARCCHPVPADPIVGYVTRGRGITIHRRDCPAILRMDEARKDRLVAAEWGERQENKFSVEIELEAYDRQGLLRDVTDVFLREKVNVTKVNTLSEKHQAQMVFSIEVADLDHLSRVLTLLHNVPNVRHARRRG